MSINICTAFVNKYTIDHNINIVFKSVAAYVAAYDLFDPTHHTLEVEKESTDTSGSTSSKCRRLSIVAKFQSSLIHDPKNRHLVICFHCLFSRSFCHWFSPFLFPFVECIVAHVIANHQIEWNAIHICIHIAFQRTICVVLVLYLSSRICCTTTTTTLIITLDRLACACNKSAIKIEINILI